MDQGVQETASTQQTSHHSGGDSWDQPHTTVVSSRGQRNRQPPTQQHGSHRPYHRPALTVARRCPPRNQLYHQHGRFNSHPIRPPPAVYIALRKPLNSNYTIPRRPPVPHPPAETTVFPRSSSTSFGVTKPRDEQRQLEIALWHHTLCIQCITQLLMNRIGRYPAIQKLLFGSATIPTTEEIIQGPFQMETYLACMPY
jgi:hypothetical protein